MCGKESVRNNYRIPVIAPLYNMVKGHYVCK